MEKTKKKNAIKMAWDDKIFGAVVWILVILVLIVTLYPLIYVFSMSVSDPLAVLRGEVYFLPIGFDLTAIKRVLSDSSIYRYYANTLYYTVMAVAAGIVTTMLAAYPLSRKNFKHRGLVTIYFTLTMFFGGGLMANYIVVVKFLNLYNSRATLTLLGLTTCWYIMVARNFIKALPEDLFDSAKIDGASEFNIFWKVVMPLSKPVISVLAVHFGVGEWNSYFSAMLYLPNKKLQPLSLYVRHMVIQGNLDSMLNDLEMVEIDLTTILSSLQIKYAVILISVLPLMLMYPIFGKHMKNGLMVGAIKG